MGPEIGIRSQAPFSTCCRASLLEKMPLVDRTGCSGEEGRVHESNGREIVAIGNLEVAPAGTSKQPKPNQVMSDGLPVPVVKRGARCQAGGPWDRLAPEADPIGTFHY